MQDTERRPVITCLEGEPPTQNNDLQLYGVGTRKLRNNKHQLHIENEILYYFVRKRLGPLD